MISGCFITTAGKRGKALLLSSHLCRPPRRRWNSTQQSGGPITQAYQAHVATHQIQHDADQYKVAAQLDHLYHALIKYTPPRLTSTAVITDIKPRNPLQRISLAGRQLIHQTWQQQKSKPPKGLYIYGSVGVGKSYLMDLFYETLAGHYDDAVPSLTTHRRAHFHEFMLDVHERVHAAKRVQPKADVLPTVALALAQHHRLLCFDEFQVTDIADAMILQRLFGMLWKAGVVVVATSNRAPRHLYEGGINRSRFLPFIDLLSQRMEVMEMTGTRDYRRVDTAPPSTDTAQEDNDDTTTADAPSFSQCFFSPTESEETREALQNIFDTVAKGQTVQDERIAVPMGRILHVTRAATTGTAHDDDSNSDNNTDNNVAWLDFDELCAKPLGAADYLALCRRYRVLIVDHVPQLNANTFNEARRFVTFIDAVYETRAKLVLATAVPMDELFQSFDAHVETHDGDEEIAVAGQESVVKGEGGASSSHATTMLQNRDGTEVEWSATGRIGVSLAQLSAVRDVAFSFARAESRLAEMSRPSWWKKQ